MQYIILIIWWNQIYVINSYDWHSPHFSMFHWPVMAWWLFKNSQNVPALPGSWLFTNPGLRVSACGFRCTAATFVPSLMGLSWVSLSHDGSMVLVYMLTWLGYIDGIHVTIYPLVIQHSYWKSPFLMGKSTISMVNVTIYSSTMDPMGPSISDGWLLRPSQPAPVAQSWPAAFQNLHQTLTSEGQH